ncbi:hypothetical protein GGS21DRAFT_97911 [Xylaria nigripes]|nr:hypothetical protein GGS21DRAFT_97911 [Xylaria nigripes]
MASQDPGTTNLPKPCQYHDFVPKTPEPLAPGAGEQSLPPRPRLRLKRRHASQFTAPTQQFLASIAAADVPIPSVEDVDRDMIDTLPEFHVEDFDNIDVCQHLTPRVFSPPKTPAIDLAGSLGPINYRYPDWYSDSTWSDSDLESSSDYESSRPSTAFSTQTSSSLFSLYSHATEDAHCISPDLDAIEFPHKADSKNTSLRSGQDNPRKAPWTKAMSSHLWATYMLYLSDPKVTPIRLGKSSIPPHGVCARVARQAQRSWRGPKAQPTNEAKSKGGTPTAETSKTYIQWPHTGGATRAHLRELCRMKATNKGGRYLSRSPTPFNKAANLRWNQRPIIEKSHSVFSAQDMAMSLTLSASDTMQSQGPLAQLASSHTRPPISLCELGSEQALSREPHEKNIIAETPATPRAFDEPLMEINDKFSCHSPHRLGSPFLAKSYGPSSSSAAKISLRQQSNTVGGPRKLLKSPPRFTRSRSGTQKRRSVKSHEERAWKRPSLASAFFREGSRNAEATVTIPSADSQSTQSASENSTTSDRCRLQSAFQLESTASPAIPDSMSRPFVVSAVPSQPSPSRPTRLGSPFSAAASSSYSFPNRLSSPSSFSLAALRKPFATVQQTQVSIPATPTPTRSSLASRLAYLDQRLKELRNRGIDGRRSQSPL